MKIEKAIEQELGCKFIRMILTKKTLIFLKSSASYLGTSNNRLKKL